MNYIDIKGVVETDMDMDEFIDKFIDFIEENDSTFGGGYYLIDENGDALED